MLPRVRFVSLRSKLFAAFAGVLVLSLVLTGATFWGEISLNDTQQVQSELQAAAPTVFAQVKQRLDSDVLRPQASLESLRDTQLLGVARQYGVRILLIDYCNHVLVDTDSTTGFTPMQLLPGCSQILDDVTGTSPAVVNLAPSSGRVLQTGSLPHGEASYYVAYSAGFYGALQGNANLLPLRTIIIAKSTGGVDQQALNTILTNLVPAGLFAVCLTLLVVVAIVRAIARPLHSITLASERMAAGEYDQRVPEAGDDEVGQLARSFNRMASEVNTARETQRQLIANVSHDLKTPLTSIVGFCQVLADSDEVVNDPTQRRAVQVINEEARRLQRLTQDLLDLSRLEAGQLQLRRSAIDVNQLAGRALARYVDLPANASIHFRDERSQDDLVVFVDADKLMQALVNLLDNAVKFSDAQGTVALSTTRRQGAALLTVSNTGPGIPPEDLTRIFQRFYRTDRSRASSTGGTGLGLAIVREIVSAHGGTVEARNSGDGWTHFVVSLPLLLSRLPPHKETGH